jgi:hypothetical protein
MLKTVLEKTSITVEVQTHRLSGHEQF